MKGFILGPGDLTSSMHAIKGGWVGQPFALAKHNDSGGKRSRIRRSKEERKAMVESFIKKYQKSNNGNFPSLNLTHKEVGGSFYTVREIVREVIQENRVLGPAKLTAEEHNKLLEQYPTLESSSVEPKDLSPFSEVNLVTNILPNHHQNTSEDLVLNSHAWCIESEYQRYEKGETMNQPIKDVEKKDHDKLLFTESQAGENLELEESAAELETPKNDITDEAANQISPLVSSSLISGGLDEKSIELGELTCTVLEKEIEKLEMEAGSESVADVMNSLESSSVLGDKETDTGQGGVFSQEGHGLVDEKQVSNVEAALEENKVDNQLNPLVSSSLISSKSDKKSSELIELTGTIVQKNIEKLGMEAGHDSIVHDMNSLESCSILGIEDTDSNQAGVLSRDGHGLADEKPVNGDVEAALEKDAIDFTTKERSILDTNVSIQSEVQDAAPAEIKHIDRMNNVHEKNPESVSASSSYEQSISTEEVANENHPGVQTGDISSRGSNPTPDRKNLESSETSWTKPTRPETNPLLEFLKALGVAFVKLFSR